MADVVGTDVIRYMSAEARGREFAERVRGERPLFCCVVAHTDTCLLPGVSAAGATEALRAYTPAADAEALLYGTPRCLPDLPRNPLGPPGPVGITRAAVRLADLPVEIIAAGLRVWPEVPFTNVRCSPGGSIEEGRAVAEAADLYEAGRAIGRDIAGRAPYLVLAESVPGGTTTALALLLALGVNAEGRVSGSVPGNAHGLKAEVARQALAAAGLGWGAGSSDPLGAVARIGDPMQPIAAGIASAVLAAGRPVLLAGGCQMVAVAALLRALGVGSSRGALAVGTTRWVACDPAADVPGLARDVDPGLALLAANLNFSASRHPLLRRYEESLVKEGVGAGGACIAAHLSVDADLTTLHGAIDEAYDLVLPCALS